MGFAKIYTGAEPQRVNKWLAQSGVCSRREAEAFIEQGLVFIDGRRIEDPGHKIEPGETLTLAEEARKALDTLLTVALHKPVGFVSSQPESNQTPAVRLVKRDTLWGGTPAHASTRAKLAPVGRLDQDSRGLLLLSEDGVLAKAVIGPDSTVDKEYLVRVAGSIDEQKLALLRNGLSLDGRKLKPAKVSVSGQQRLRFILHEGRNRQIRRMCEAVDLKVVDLLRTRIGAVSLGKLPEGRWRPLTSEERVALLGGVTP
jgi:23S rRNA pseudouridine2604 synthase